MASRNWRELAGYSSPVMMRQCLYKLVMGVGQPVAETGQDRLAPRSNLADRLTLQTVAGGQRRRTRVLPAGRQWPQQVHWLHGVFRVLQARATHTDLDGGIRGIFGQKILSATVLLQRPEAIRLQRGNLIDV